MDAGYDEAPITWDLRDHLDQVQILVTPVLTVAPDRDLVERLLGTAVWIAYRHDMLHWPSRGGDRDDTS